MHNEPAKEHNVPAATRSALGPLRPLAFTVAGNTRANAPHGPTPPSQRINTAPAAPTPAANPGHHSSAPRPLNTSEPRRRGSQPRLQRELPALHASELGPTILFRPSCECFNFFKCASAVLCAAMGDPVFVTPTSPSPRRDNERTPARRRAASAQCSRMLHLLIASAEAVRIRHEENERLLRATETRPFNAALPEPVISALDNLSAPAADDAAALAALAVETTSAAPVVPGPPCDPSVVPLPHDSDTEAEIMDTTASRKRQRPSESSDDEGGSRKVPAIAPEEPQSPPTAIDAPPPTDAPPAPSMDEAGFQLVQSKAQRRRERKGATAAPAPRSNAGTETPTAPPPTAATAAPAVSTAATSPDGTRELHPDPRVAAGNGPRPLPDKGLARRDRSRLLRLRIGSYRTAERLHRLTGGGSLLCTDEETLEHLLLRCSVLTTRDGCYLLPTVDWDYPGRP
ncbi:hypothetical protein HPB50_029076 [Hyalomma asiaticum]|nr:hypothetical protein HPB50_029076 [Hyalomma asiaticum]